MRRFLLIVLLLTARLAAGHAVVAPDIPVIGDALRVCPTQQVAPAAAADLPCSCEEETEEEDSDGPRTRPEVPAGRGEGFLRSASYRNELHLFKISLSLHIYYCLFRN